MSSGTVLITGSSKGIGKALAIKFAAHGYNIILHGRDEKKLCEVKRHILKNNVNCYVVIGDISEDDTIDNLTACAEKNGIDILINNAGMYLKKSVEEIQPDEFRKVIEVNLIAPVLLTKRIFKLYKKKGSGLIVNINSVAGKGFSENEGAYCASKHGLKGLMGCFKFEALKSNVSVIDIFLGATNTDITALRKDQNKLIKPEEVADFIYSISQNYSSMRISEIDILRKIY